MSMWHNVSVVFLEMALYGFIQVNLKDHLGSEFKGAFIKLKLNYCPDPAQEKDLESVLCCNCPALIILVFSEPLHPTSVTLPAVASHCLMCVHLPDSSFIFRLILSGVCICFSHSLFLCFFFPSCALQVDYVTLKNFGKNPLWKMLYKEISISRCTAFLTDAHQEFIRYQSLKNSSEEQYVIMKVKYQGPNSICNVEKSYQWVMSNMTLTVGQNIFINMADS